MDTFRSFLQNLTVEELEVIRQRLYQIRDSERGEEHGTNYNEKTNTNAGNSCKMFGMFGG